MALNLTCVYRISIASCSVTALTSVHTKFYVIPIEQYSPFVITQLCVTPLPQEKED